MDNSWQIKCSSTWLPSTTPSLASSSQLPPQGPRSQTEANAIQCFHPFTAREFSLTDSGVMQEPMVLNTLNLSSSQSGKPDMANSFLALLSGSPLQLQSEFQQLSSSSSRSAMAAGKFPEHDNNIVVSGPSCGVPIAPIMPLNQHQGNGNKGNAAEFCPVVPSRAASTTSYGCASFLHDNFQLANLNHQSSDSAKTGFDHSVSNNERRRNLRQGCPSTNPPGNSYLLNKTTIQSSPKIPSESKAVMLDSPPAFTRGHPLVFCLGKTGNLLLSNTGLLGVVCSCHNLHMSIAKFCVHSGLRTVKPGDAVCLESGETVSQWRQLYFHKLGIRVPDEHSEWDWPEEFSATGGLVKCRETVPNMAIKSDMFLPVDSVGGTARFGQTRNTFVSPRISHTGQSVEKSVDTVLHNAWQKNAQEGHNLVSNRLIGTSSSILPALAADGQIMKENPISGGLPMSNTTDTVGRQDTGCRLISDYIDLLKAGNLLTSDPSMGSPNSLGIDSDARRYSSSLEGLLVGREAISSNIELRLGQPSQRSHTVGGSILSTVGPHPFITLGDSQKAPYQEHVIHNMANPWITEGSRQSFGCMLLDTSNFNQREAESQLNFRNHALGSSNAIDAVELSKGDVDRNSLIPMFLQHFRPPTEGVIQSQTADNMVNSVDNFLAKVPDGESHVAKTDPANFIWTRRDGTQKQLNSHGLGLHNHTERGKGVLLADNCPNVSADGSSTFHGRHVAESNPFNGVIGGYCLPSSSPVLSSPYLGQLPGVLPDANKPSNPISQVSFTQRDGQLDHAFLRSIHSFPLSAGPGIPLSTTSMGFSTATSISGPSPTPPPSKKEGSAVNQQLLEENLRLLVLKHMVELSKQENEIALQEMNPEQGRLHTPSDMEVQRKFTFQDPLTSEQLREGIYVTIKQDAAEPKPLQPCSNCGLCGGREKLVDFSGRNTWCNFSTVPTQGSTLCSKDLGIQCPPSHDPVMHEHPLLRLGRLENNNVAASGEHAKCFHKEPTYFPGKCSCCVHSMCLAGSVSKGESSLGVYKENIGCVEGQNSLLVASVFGNSNMISYERAVAVGQCKNVKRQISANKDCSNTQWNDVSCRVKGVHNATCIRRPSEELDGRENVEDQFVDTASKVYICASQEAEPLKEQQMSNICTGWSAPAVTEVSIEVNNIDFCTADTEYVTDRIVDEGSGIEKCWSSDDALDSGRSAHTPIITAKVDSTKVGSSALPSQSSNADEIIMRNPLRLKKVSNQHASGCAFHDNINHMKQFERGLKTGKKKKAMKWRSLDASFPPSGVSSVQFKLPKCAGHTELHSCSSKEMQYSSQPPVCGTHGSGSCSLKRKHSPISSSKTLSKKRSLQGLDVHHKEFEDDNQKQLKGSTYSIKVPKLSGMKKVKWGCCENVSNQFDRQDTGHVETDKAANDSSVGCMKSLSNPHMDTRGKKAKPIICGNSGIIFNEKLAEGLAKPPKIVSLSVILKKAGRFTITENEQLALTSMIETKKSNLRSNGCNNKVSVLKKERDNKGKSTVINETLENGSSTKKACFSKNEGWVDELSMLQKEEDDGCHTEHSDLHGLSSVLLKPRFKEARKRSLYELTSKGKNSGSAKFSHTKLSKCTLQTKCRSHGKLHLKDAEDSQEQPSELCQVNSKISIKEHKSLASVLASNVFCCVCGSSNKDEMNYLLECGRCSIRVHQACYGVTKVPKGHWSCRPCRTSSEHIVCVLCGYEGGAMTRAIRSTSVVKSLLKAWNTLNIPESVNCNPLSKALQDESRALDALISVHGADLVPTVRRKSSKPYPIAMLKMDLPNQKIKDGSSHSPRVYNTVTAGVLDPTIMQWVHMVCGLWTPGTRCPNVDTMSAFDVSGAQRPGKNVVCSLCNRPGGSCIRCRIANCSVRFHPWCGHLKGLLQSEVEGVDNENVGFYGRCELHATHYKCVPEDHHVGTEMERLGQKDTTCARTEGYKGRRRDGFTHNHHGQPSDNGGCLVPQEQINAWLHINGQKSSIRGFLKPPASDVEHDCRKEYARYKQAKGWKHLVVYKSGIHALGLYTSRFISRGSMVVEYVGEIVGLRVADKRENEYHSGRKLQYKSACYFFRIDKEHIIDATCKGGIARFVNHSCLPNCVAKVISVRNEKKVVFFAERDINPGEEITYDYHFNHEDEGKKIPCFCNSKNCRRYLN